MKAIYSKRSPHNWEGSNHHSLRPPSLRDNRNIRLKLVLTCANSCQHGFQTLWPSAPHVTPATPCSNHSASQLLRLSDNGERICSLAQLAEGGRCFFDRAHSSWCCSLFAENRLVHVKTDTPWTTGLASSPIASLNCKCNILSSDNPASTTTTHRLPFFLLLTLFLNRSQSKPLQQLLPHTRSTRLTKSFFYRSALL